MPFDIVRYTELRRQGLGPSLAKQLAKIDFPVDGGGPEDEEDEE